MGVIAEPIDTIVDRIVQRVTGIREVFSEESVDVHRVFRKRGVDFTKKEETQIRADIKSRIDEEEKS